MERGVAIKTYYIDFFYFDPLYEKKETEINF